MPSSPRAFHASMLGLSGFPFLISFTAFCIIFLSGCPSSPWNLTFWSFRWKFKSNYKNISNPYWRFSINFKFCVCLVHHGLKCMILKYIVWYLNNEFLVAFRNVPDIQKLDVVYLQDEWGMQIDTTQIVVFLGCQEYGWKIIFHLTLLSVIITLYSVISIFTFWLDFFKY